MFRNTFTLVVYIAIIVLQLYWLYCILNFVNAWPFSTF